MNIKRLFLVPLMGLVITLSALAVTPGMLKCVDRAAAAKWVDSVYNALTPHQRVAQLFVPAIGPGMANAKTSIKTLVGDDGVGGLLFSESTLGQYATMVNYARSMAKVPLLMTFDGEWGPAMRLKDTPRFPHNMALGAVANERLLYDYGREMARECRQLGINVNFAPVMDVNSNPANPVIGYRSFGEDPQRVAALGIAYSKGLEDGGVIAVAKHFPGHGDTSADSHKSLPEVKHSAEKLRATDLVPFTRYVSEGLSGVMMGHLKVPALDHSGTPASLSHKITTSLLKEKMGFEGLVFTDALSMKGAALSHGNNCVEALKAGADMLLASDDPHADIKAVEQALSSGRLTWKLIEQRCKKVLLYKYALKGACGLLRSEDVISRSLNNAKSADLNRRLSAAVITVVANKSSLLPIGNLAGKRVAVVNLGDKASNDFTAQCAKYTKIDSYAPSGEQITASQLAAIRKHDIIIAAIYDDNASTRHQLSQLKDLKSLVPVFFINPYRMGKFKGSIHNLATIVTAHDDTPYLRGAAAQALFGGINVTGRMPVNVNGVAAKGAGVKLSKTRLGYTSPTMEGMSDWVVDSVDSIVNRCLAFKAFPGCQVLVAKGGNVVIDKSYGTLDYTHAAKVDDQTIYDLASVSKATGTLPGVMAAYDGGLFSLDDPASKFIPGLRDTDKADITMCQLLHHESGMKAALNTYQTMMDTATYTGDLITQKPTPSTTVKISRNAYGNPDAKLRLDLTSPKFTAATPVEAAKGIFVGQAAMDTIMSRIYRLELRPDKSYTYSCLNFALLMDAEQRLTGKRHDRWVDEKIFAPLGMCRTAYRPLDRFSVAEIAPTEQDTYLRRQLVRGYVHDEMACMSGGIQGNAGLFSTADDLAKLCQMWLNGGTYGGVRVLSPSTVKLFTTDKSATCRRGLGFDKPDTRNPSVSPTTGLAPASTYGHLGFTGTCFWVDPDNQLIYIFLNNRVYPTRDNQAFSSIDPRPKIFEQVYHSIGRR